MEDDIKNLEDKVAVLTAWKDARIRERLWYPIDIQSRRTMDYWKATGKNGSSVTGLLIATGKILNADYLNLSTSYTSFDVEVSINGVKKTILLSLPLLPFTADISTDVITNTNGQHNMQNGEIVSLTSDNQLPTPLDFDVLYFVVNKTGNTFQLSASKGGSPIDLTSLNSGNFYYAKIT